MAAACCIEVPMSSRPFSKTSLRDFELEHQAVLIGDRLVRQVYSQRITFFFFRALEEFLDLLFGQRSGKNPVLEAIVVKNVRIARGNDHSKTVVLDAPGRVLAA